MSRWTLLAKTLFDLELEQVFTTYPKSSLDNLLYKFTENGLMYTMQNSNGIHKWESSSFLHNLINENWTIFKIVDPKINTTVDPIKVEKQKIQSLTDILIEIKKIICENNLSIEIHTDEVAFNIYENPVVIIVTKNKFIYIDSELTRPDLDLVMLNQLYLIVKLLTDNVDEILKLMVVQDG